MMTKKQVNDARFYERLNVRMDELDGSKQSVEYVKTQWKIAFRHATINKEDLVLINLAKDYLIDNDKRLGYNASLQTHGSLDGRTKKENWEEWLKNRGEQDQVEQEQHEHPAKHQEKAIE